MSLQLPSTIWVATAPINLRLSFDRLAGIVRAELGGDPKQPLLVVTCARPVDCVARVFRQHSGRV